MVGVCAGLRQLAESGDQDDAREHDTPGKDAPGAQPAQQRRAAAAAAANRRVVEALAARILEAGEPAAEAAVDPGAAVAELARATGGAGRQLLLLALRAALASGALCLVFALAQSVIMSCTPMARWPCAWHWSLALIDIDGTLRGWPRPVCKGLYSEELGLCFLKWLARPVYFPMLHTHGYGHTCMPFSEVQLLAHGGT